MPSAPGTPAARGQALAEGGLRRALKTLARRSAVPVLLNAGVDGRLPEPIELAAYYVVAEALTNTAKHASATIIDVQVETSADGRARKLTASSPEGCCQGSRLTPRRTG